MARHDQLIKIADLILSCSYCRPLTGCIMSDLKKHDRQGIIASLSVLTDKGLERLLSFHARCPFREASAS